jgi:hypothetical protein
MYQFQALSIALFTATLVVVDALYPHLKSVEAEQKNLFKEPRDNQMVTKSTSITGLRVDIKTRSMNSRER